MKKLILSGALVAALALPSAASAADPSPADFKNASKYCKALKAASGSNFSTLYKNHGKCVSAVAKQKAAEEAKQEEAAQKNASQQCRDERAADPQAFATKYGTNKNGKNAFGKCVSQKAKADKTEADEQEKAEDEAKIEAAKQCKAERKADPAAFEQKYGTNRNKRNAFGKCVSRTANGSTEQPAQG